VSSAIRHRAAKALAPPPPLVDGLPAAAEKASGRAAQAFGQAERYGVGLRGEVGDGDPESDGGIEDARSVEVYS